MTEFIKIASVQNLENYPTKLRGFIMADKMKVPFVNPDGSMTQKIGTLMEITDSKEPWSEYTLADGTKIRIKQTLISVAKLDGKTAPNGDPVYAVRSQQTMSIFPKI